jgi:hypothetical protein
VISRVEEAKKKKMMWTSAKIPVLVALAVIVTGLACGASSATEAPVVSTATSDTQPAEVEESTTAPQPPTKALPTSAPAAEFLGDTAYSSGYSLTAVSAEDPAKPGTFYQPSGGQRLVAIDVVVGNVSGDPLSVNPLNAILIDQEGFTYQPELAGRDGQIATVDAFPGERVRGWIAFEIPEAATVSSVRYSSSLFSSDFIEVGLTKPPDGHQSVGDPWTPPSTGELPKLGDVVEQFGYSLSAASLEDPAPPGMLYEPKQGHKLVAVEIVVGNTSGDQITVNPLNAILVDADGFLYSPELAGRDGQIELVDLTPGLKAKGWVAFTIPEDAAPTSIKYLVEPFSSAFLQAGLSSQ